MTSYVFVLLKILCLDIIMRSIKLMCCQVFLAIFYLSKYVVSNPVLNNFNNNLRDYSVNEADLVSVLLNQSYKNLKDPDSTKRSYFAEFNGRENFAERGSGKICQFCSSSQLYTI